MTTFSVTGMLSVIAEIPRESYDHARTLRMNPWRTVYEVVVLGTADRMLEVVRQNGAMGWIMLTMAEGLVRSEGGLGVLLLNENRQMRLDTVYALQLTIFMVAIGMDFVLARGADVLFPYAGLTRGSK
jgi:NitT/TauT family transport system permease protein